MTCSPEASNKIDKPTTRLNKESKKKEELHETYKYRKPTFEGANSKKREGRLRWGRTRKTQN